MSWFRRSAIQRHWKLIIYLIIYVFWSSRLFEFMKYNIRIDYKLFHTFQNWNQKIFRFYDILILSWVVLQLVRINFCQLLFLSLILSGSFDIFCQVSYFAFHHFEPVLDLDLLNGNEGSFFCFELIVSMIMCTYICRKKNHETMMNAISSKMISKQK